MSGTLPKINLEKNLFGIKFGLSKKYRLENKHKLFLSTLTHVGPKNNLKLDFKY